MAMPASAAASTGVSLMPKLRWQNRTDLLNRLDQVARRKRLFQVGDTTCFQGGLARGFVVGTGDEYYRKRNPGTRQSALQFYSTRAIQIDIENKARCPAETSAAEEAFDRIE